MINLFKLPSKPNVPVSKMLKSPFKRACNGGISARLPCIFAKLCSHGFNPLSEAKCFNKVVVVVFPFVPVIQITGCAGSNNLKISSTVNIGTPNS